MASLTSAISIGALRLRNRLYRAPVLEGAGSVRDPAKVLAKHFVPNARAGVGLIIQGNTVVEAEGRTSPGMACLADFSELAPMRVMTDAVHEEGAAIVIQLGHGGIYALESWSEEWQRRRTRAPLAVSPPPLWLRPFQSGVHVASTADVEALIQRFSGAALAAREAGYDGVQLAASNAKLLHQFLSRSFNRRQDRYGGSVAGRAQILIEIREAIAKSAGPEFPVLLKYAALERSPAGSGITAAEGVEIARIAESAGFVAITPAAADVLPNTAICRGDYPARSFTHPNVAPRLREFAGSAFRYQTLRAGFRLAAQRYPFEPVWNRDLIAAVRNAVDVPVFGVGGIRTRAEIDTLLQTGVCDVVGLGRPFYAEPALARRLLDNENPNDEPTLCESCNQCVVPQMLGMPGVCYNPAVNRKRRQ